MRPNAQQLAARLRQGGYQALYMNNQPQSNLEGYLAAQLAGVPVIQHCRSNPALSPRAVAAANQAARIIAVSHGIADSLRAQGVDPARIRVVPNGIDPTQPLPDPAACRARLGVSADTVRLPESFSDSARPWSSDRVVVRPCASVTRNCTSVPAAGRSTPASAITSDRFI